MIWLSLPLGLLAWLLPIVLRNKKIKPTAVSAASFFLCILALLNVLWELYRRTVSGDHSALMDITPALTACSAALVIGTLLLNLWLHLSKLPLPRHLPRVPPFWTALLLQATYYLGVSIYAAYFGGHITGYHLGIRSGLLGLAVALVLLIMYRVKAKDEELSLHVPGAVLVFPAVELLLFYLPMVLPGNTQLPYEYGSDFLRALFFCYYLPTLLLSVMILNIWPIVKDNLRDWIREKKAAPNPGVLPFLIVLLLQTMAFLPAPLLAVNGCGDWTGYRMGVFYCSVPLGLAVVLLAVYLHKTPKERVSFGVPLAVAAFLPVQYLLQSIPVLLGVQADVLPYEWDQFMNAFYPFYYLPVLLMTATSVGWLRFLVWRKDRTLPKLTLRRPVLVQVLAVAVLAVLGMVLTLRRPDIHLEKGEFLMLESDAPMFFAVAFSVVTLLFGLFLLVIYRKRKQKTGLVCFLLQWAFTLAAFYFLMTGLTLRPGDVGGMYTETVSLNVGLAGLCWAVGIVCMGFGLKTVLEEKKGDPHESE